jgi:hypothetical protein
MIAIFCNEVIVGTFIGVRFVIIQVCIRSENTGLCVLVVAYSCCCVIALLQELKQPLYLAPTVATAVQCKQGRLHEHTLLTKRHIQTYLSTNEQEKNTALILVF